MIVRVLLALLLVSSAPALAEGPPAADTPAKGPVMGELMKHQPHYVYAWQNMMSGETPPAWLKEYAASLDGPPTPTIPVLLDGEVYTLGFTCKPNACETDQLYVLFAPEGRDAWGLLATADGISWLGRPSDRVKDAINGSLRK